MSEVRMVKIIANGHHMCPSCDLMIFSIEDETMVYDIFREMVNTTGLLYSLVGGSSHIDAQ